MMRAALRLIAAPVPRARAKATTVREGLDELFAQTGEAPMKNATALAHKNMIRKV